MSGSTTLSCCELHAVVAPVALCMPCCMSYLEHLPPPRVVPRGQHVLFDLLRQRERLRLRTSAKQRSAAQHSAAYRSVLNAVRQQCLAVQANALPLWHSLCFNSILPSLILSQVSQYRFTCGGASGLQSWDRQPSLLADAQRHPPLRLISHSTRRVHRSTPDGWLRG